MLSKNSFTHRAGSVQLSSWRGKNFPTLAIEIQKTKIEIRTGRLGTGWDGLWDGLNIEITQCLCGLGRRDAPYTIDN